MSKHVVLVCLALTAALPALAQRSGAGDALESIRQLSPTQAHLRAFEPKEEPRHRSPGPALARAAGKLLSPHAKRLDLDLDIDDEPEPNASGLPDDRSAVRFNRRAEIVYENYRLAVKRKGVQMSYQIDF